MSKEVLDAVKTAKSIHDGDYSSLCDKSFVVCDNKKKKRRGSHVKKSKKNKYTLNQVGTKLDQIGDVLFLLVDRFNYVIKANNLKDLPKQNKKEETR